MNQRTIKIKFIPFRIRYGVVISVISLLIITGFKTTAQDVTDTEEVTVVAPYQPSVADMAKISISPEIPAEGLEKPAFNYTMKSKTLEPEVILEPIKPAKIQGESVPELYKNYIRAGIGNYWTPYIEFNANKLRSKKNAFGVHAKYLSSFGGIEDYAFPGSSISTVDGYGKAFFNQHTLSAEAQYQRTGVHFYGFKPGEFPDIDLDKNDYKQSYNLIGLKTGIESNYLDRDKLHHSVNLKYYYLFDKFDAHEHNVRFDAGMSKSTSFFGFSEREKLGIDLGINYFYNMDSIRDFNSSIIMIRPYYYLGFEQYYFKVGLNGDAASGSDSKVHVYPVVRAEVQVVEDVLITYAGIYGELNKNSLHSMSDENPFINSTFEKKFENNKLSQYGGLKGHITPYFDYNLSFENSTIDGMAFYVNDTVSALGEGLNNQFTVVYDKVKYSKVIAEFGFHYKNKFNAILLGKYNSYFCDNEDKAWHKPALEISFMANYNMQDKILIKGELLTHSSIYARTFESITVDETTTTNLVPVRLDGYADISLGGEYRYSKLLSGFINFNNILGQRYFRWYNYPSYRFNIMLGVTYSF